MLRIFVGFDSRESIAYHVLAHSLARHSSQMLQITPLILGKTGLGMKQEGSTEFTRSRFLVPLLCRFEGQAIFMDCDMLCRRFPDLEVDEDAAVSVVKHDYNPVPDDKFLGQAQTAYPRKNWSSFMVFNNALCKRLTFDYVRTASLMQLHQFKWCGDDQIGSLYAGWNYLVGEEQKMRPDVYMAHYTRGGPWFPQFADCEYAQEWRAELKEAMSCLQ